MRLKQVNEMQNGIFIFYCNAKCGLRECVVISKCPSVLKLVFQVNVNRSQQNTILQAKHQNYFVTT